MFFTKKPPSSGFFYARRVLLRCWPNKTRKPNRHAGFKRFWDEFLRKLGCFCTCQHNLRFFAHLPQVAPDQTTEF